MIGFERFVSSMSPCLLWFARPLLALGASPCAPIESVLLILKLVAFCDDFQAISSANSMIADYF